MFLQQQYFKEIIWSNCCTIPTNVVGYHRINNWAVPCSSLDISWFQQKYYPEIISSIPSSILLKELLHNCAIDAMFKANQDILDNNSNVFIC